MVIHWSKTAQYNVDYFIYNSKSYTKKNIISYTNSLISYISNLSLFPYLGHVLFNFQELQIRQLIFRKHRILYYISNNEIHILTILHTTQDINKFINNSNNNLNLTL